MKNNISLNSKLEEDFIDFMTKLDFPLSSIILEPSFIKVGPNQQYRPDMALIDPKSKALLAFIELISRDDSEKISNAGLNVQKYLKLIDDESVKGYIVTKTSSPDKFKFYALNEYGEPRLISSTQIPNLESLVSAHLVGNRVLISEKKKETTDRFNILCYFACGIAILLVIADFVCTFFNVRLLTTERIALLGAALFLVLIPFFQKFKGLGIEFERVKKRAKELTP